MASYTYTEYSTALYPQFNVPEGTPSLRVCAGCRRKVEHTIRCKCKCRAYCSKECKSVDLTVHAPQCELIYRASMSVGDSAVHFDQRFEEIDASLIQDYYTGNLFEFGGDRHDRHNSYHSLVKSYFLKRQGLITALIKDGLAGMGDGATQTNELAFDIAVMQCRHLLILDKYDSYYCREDGLVPNKELLMNLYLFTGRYQELYDLCCFFVKNGEKYFPHRSPRYIGRVSSPNHACREDITKSFFLHNSLHHESFPLVALNHMYIVKQMLHHKTEILRLIDTHFLQNKDCIQLIGEYIGMKREWLVNEKDWYQTQALETLYPFVGCNSAIGQFGNLYGSSELFANCWDFQHISAIKYTGLVALQSMSSDSLQPLLPGSFSYDDSNLKRIRFESNPPFFLNVMDEAGKTSTLTFLMRKTTKMKNLFEAYGLKRGIERSLFSFSDCIGTPIEPEDTAESQSLVDNDIIECALLQSEPPIKRAKLGGHTTEATLTLNDAVFFCQPDGELDPVCLQRTIQQGLARQDLLDVVLAARTNARIQRWRDTLKLYAEDHTLIHQRYIKPLFDVAAGKLNCIAGHDVMSRNFGLWSAGNDVLRNKPDSDLIDWYQDNGPAYGFITSFVAEAMKICQEHMYQFDDFIEYMDRCNVDDVTEMCMPWAPPACDFSYGLMAAVLLERKIAQACYYISLLSGKVNHIFDQLPNGNKLRRVYPPPLDQYDPFGSFPLRGFSDTLDPDLSDRIRLVSRWLPDVTNVVESLFDAGLATHENLSQIFGDGALVSQTIWELEQAKLKSSQRSILSLMPNNGTNTQQKGCTLWDPKSGLKIEKLKIIPRRIWYATASDKIKSRIVNLSPSIEQFRERFPTDNLNLDIVEKYAVNVSLGGRNEFYGANGLKCDLQEFKTVEEACRHCFDTSNLEDAIFDCIGIPRMIIWNGDDKTMWRSGWRYKGRCFLGDKSLHTGSRIALAYVGRKAEFSTNPWWPKAWKGSNINYWEEP